MGILLPPNRLLSETMKIQVMCDQSRERCGSKRINGEDESIPVVSMATTFEDVEDLKARLNEIKEDVAVDSYHDHFRKGQLSHSTESIDDQTDVTHQQNSATNLLANQDKSPISKNEVLDLANVKSSNGLAHNESESDSLCTNVTIEPCEINHQEKCNTHTGTESERVNAEDASALTQDVSVDISNSARFSKVLENMSLPLLYIPTTKQLIAQDQTVNDGASHSDDIPETNDNRFKNYNDDLRNDSNPDETHDSYSGLPSLCATNAPNLSPTTEYADKKSLNVYNQDHVYYQDYMRPCDTTSTSHLFADDVSLSSVSTGTDFSVSAFSVNEDFCSHVENRSLSQTQIYEDSVFIDINLHSRNSFDSSHKVSTLENGLDQMQSDHLACTESKKGLSSLRTLFGKKVKEEGTPGWKLFGKIPPKVTDRRNPQQISSEYQARRQSVDIPNFPSEANRKQASEVTSTTALILEKRPGNLPTKSPEEEEKHRQEYNQMIEAAKKKEQRESKLKKKRLQQQRKNEDKVMSFARTWISDVLPNWESMRQSKKVRELWWLGLPPNVRGRVWMLAIGNDLNITHELYEICHKRAEDKIRLMVEAENNVSSSTQEQEWSVSTSKEDSVNVIKLDVSRTFPQLGIIQKGGPYHDLLHSLLGAYACYRPDVGYVQGMSFIAAILLLNMEVADAFVCFANVLNRPCQMAFFRMDENMMAAYYKTFEAFFKENLPKLLSHFLNHGVTPNLYLMEWVFLLFGKSLPLDVACRVWDVYCRDGEEFLFRTAIAILKLYESVLLKMDFIHIAQFLTKLPEDIRGDDLFHMLEGVRMNIDKRAFNAVHAFHKDLHETSS